jgi:hypothetical protein
MNQLRRSYATIGQAIVAAAAVAWGLLYARYVLATLFHAYDDEGYFLLSLARYFRPGPLDPGTFNPYGPFYYYAQQACFRLFGLPVTHDAGRFVTLLFWMASALLAGVFVYRVSRSLLLGAAATLSCISVASVLAHEPGHPQQEILVLLTLAACLSLSIGTPRKGASLLLLGAVGAALMFSKINVGAFYLAALAHALFCVLAAGRLRSTGTTILLAYAILAPPLVAHNHLFTGAGAYCAVASMCAAATFFWGALIKPERPLDLRLAWLAAAGTVAAAALIAIASACQGVSLPTLVDAVLLEPARHPAGSWFVGFRLGLPWCLATAVVLSGIACLGWFGERLAPFRFWLGALRCGVGLAVILLLVRTDLAFVVPFLPLGVIPITRRVWQLSEWFPRLFIADLAATQFLQTYPVAGSQIGIASVPVLLWAFVCMVDGVDELGGLARRPSRALCHGAAGALVLTVVAAVMWHSGTRWNGYRYPPSRLKGAASLHLPPQQAETCRFLAGSIAANCSVMFTIPRQHSFNLWSGVAQPKDSEIPVALQMYTWERQQHVLDQLESEERACVLYNRELLLLWQTTPETLARLPLVGYVLQQMPTAAENGAYQIRINPHRSSPWVPYFADTAP